MEQNNYFSVISKNFILLITWFCFLLSLVNAENEPQENERIQLSVTSIRSMELTSQQPKDDLAIMAMKHSRLTVFTGAISALALMTILSVIFGYAATIIPRAYTYYISTALFALFGLKMLRDGYYMSNAEAQEELEEVQTDLRKRDDEYEKEVVSTLVQDPETGVIRKSTKTSVFWLLSRIYLQAFTLTFLAEWGDRSQLTTIILAAREDVYGVIIGGILGHSFCTGLAVLGGRIIAQRISVRTVTIIGGLVFLVFALTSLFISPTEST
ncbi:putative divalent cation/proton antiporter TMEM165 isoform X2 [Prorops nasuta]|uniref:putative divalent cation/proton antiporter TMEM165 isoform X2 n=1 Tax=Prorops nasuta TaxID=863751 RepID=UPI0034CFA823